LTKFAFASQAVATPKRYQ